MDISGQILQAVDILTDVKLSKLKYDKTVQGLIYEVVDLNKGIYKVRYQGNIFTAYARDVGKAYDYNEQVFIKIPEGDFSNQKIITGRVTEQSLSASQLNNLSTTVIGSSPDISTFLPAGAFKAEPWKITAGAAVGDSNYVDNIYGDFNTPYMFNNLLSQYASQYEHLQISANFRTAFNSTHTKGNYGIEVCFFTGDEPGQEIVYKLDLGSFNGDPYGLRTYSPQSAIFAVEKSALKGIKYIRLFQEQFSWDYYSDGTTAKRITEPNIFAKDLQIKFVEVKDLSNELYYCYIATPYGATLTTDIQNIELQAKLLSRGKQVREDKCTFKWFERDLNVFPGSERYDLAAGYGWTPFDNTDSILKLNYPDIFQYHKRSFKVVVSYDDVTMSGEKEVLNGNSQYDYTIRQITSGDVIKLQLENNKNDRVLKGDWYLSYPDGTFAEVTNGKMQNSIEVGNALKFGAVIFYCAVYDYEYNFIVGTLSYDMIKSSSESDIIVTYSGQDTFNYDANGDPSADSYDEGHQLAVQVSWKEGRGASNYHVKWISPDGNQITGDLTAVVSNSMLRNLWVDSEQKLHYNISNKFDYRANNNTLSVVIELDTGERFTFTKEILFLKDGDQGTNGTSYVALVRPCNSQGQKENRYRALRYRNGMWDNHELLELKCFVYKDGELLNGSTEYNPTFDWGQSVGVNCISPTADTTIIQGIGIITDTSNSQALERYVRVEVTVKDLNANRNLKIYVFYPIDVIVGDLDENLVDLSYLPNNIKYSAAGERPEFINQARIQVTYGGHDYTSGIKSVTPELVNPTFDANKQIYKLNAVEYYNSESKRDQSSIGILKCDIENDYILHPIVMYLDTFGNAEINGWDGKYLEIGEENGKKTYILAPQVGAGKKDPATNTFTGVIMGKKNMENADSGEDYAFALRTGLFGYKDGRETFGFLDTGLAFIGQAGSGRIWFDGDHGEIYSGNYERNVGGMKIDLDDGKIDAYNFKLTSGNMTLESSGTDDCGKFEFRLGTSVSYFRVKDKQGTNLIDISQSNNGSLTYRLRSSNYNVSNQTGTQIDLEKGTIQSYDFELKTPALTITSSPSDASFSFDVNKVDGSGNGRFQIKYGSKNLFYLTSTSYYLQSYNYSNGNSNEDAEDGDLDKITGMKINLQTGKIWAKNVELSGRISASSGKIGDWIISNGTLRNSDGTIRLGTSGFRFGDYFSVTPSGLSIKYDKQNDLNDVITQIRVNAQGIKLSVSGTTTKFTDYNGNVYSGDVNCYQKSEVYTKTETTSAINVGLNGISIGFSGNTLYFTKDGGNSYKYLYNIATTSDITAGINGIRLETSTYSSQGGSTKTAYINLYNGNTFISSDTITFSGLVTFTGLQNGTTTIDGSCIKTGTIDAARINLESVRSLGGNHDISIFAYGSDLLLNGYEVYVSTDYFNINSTGSISLRGDIYINGVALDTYIKSVVGN